MQDQIGECSTRTRLVVVAFACGAFVAAGCLGPSSEHHHDVIASSGWEAGHQWSYVSSDGSQGLDLRILADDRFVGETRYYILQWRPTGTWAAGASDHLVAMAKDGLRRGHVWSDEAWFDCKLGCSMPPPSYPEGQPLAGTAWVDFPMASDGAWRDTRGAASGAFKFPIEAEATGMGVVALESPHLGHVEAVHTRVSFHGGAGEVADFLHEGVWIDYYWNQSAQNIVMAEAHGGPVPGFAFAFGTFFYAGIEQASQYWLRSYDLSSTRSLTEQEIHDQFGGPDFSWTGPFVVDPFGYTDWSNEHDAFAAKIGFTAYYSPPDPFPEDATFLVRVAKPEGEVVHEQVVRFAELEDQTAFSRNRFQWTAAWTAPAPGVYFVGVQALQRGAHQGLGFDRLDQGGRWNGAFECPPVTVASVTACTLNLTMARHVSLSYEVRGGGGLAGSDSFTLRILDGEGSVVLTQTSELPGVSGALAWPDLEGYAFSGNWTLEWSAARSLLPEATARLEWTPAPVSTPTPLIFRE